MIEKCIKKLRSAYLRLYIPMTEKKYERVRYLLQTNRLSETLVICFSGFGNGSSAKYNYINTLKTVNVNKLFILDDFGYNKQGSYYLGENGDWFLPDMIIGLIKKIKAERKIKHLVMIGSSKGGTAALFYAIRLFADSCIIGAPQYYIGDYLNTNEHRSILQGIMGNTDCESIDKLNMLLPESISAENIRKPLVYIHYSPNEHTYPEHIADMIIDLEKNGYTVYQDANYDYKDHACVAKHFPHYLHRIFNDMGMIS